MFGTSPFQRSAASPTQVVTAQVEQERLQRRHLHILRIRAPQDDEMAGPRTALDAITLWLANGLALFKTYGLFFFMFGVGLGFLMRSAARRGSCSCRPWSGQSDAHAPLFHLQAGRRGVGFQVGCVDHHPCGVS
jgi:hypothetical protein